jgi:hypothetical protein
MRAFAIFTNSLGFKYEIYEPFPRTYLINRIRKANGLDDIR